MNVTAIKDLLFRIADDKLIYGHRNSEWIGIGPVLEEDIAFASMAQDEVGHAQAYYELLHQLGEAEPDQLAFMRAAGEFRCCQLVEYPTDDYAFALIRHYLFEIADKIRLQELSHSRYRPLAELAQKIAREEKYHQMHAQTFVMQLGKANEESNGRLQAALDQLYPIAFGIFEPTVHSPVLAKEQVQPLEDSLMKAWRAETEQFLRQCDLKVPSAANFIDHFGGRSGKHTPHLPGLIAEMTEVISLDPQASW